MASIKTAISIQEPLFQQAETLAEEMRISRSRLFAMAIEEFIERHKNRKLLEQINAAYEDYPDDDERAQMQQMKRYQRRLAE
jgi:metal-responsive CopG/Arc/MetJ family transcriptional regulator